MNGSGKFRILLSSSKKNLDSYCFLTFYEFISLKNDVNIALKSYKQRTFKTKKRSLTKIARSGSGSVSQRYGFANPDPYQNVTDPQHWILLCDCLVAGREERVEEREDEGGYSLFLQVEAAVQQQHSLQQRGQRQPVQESSDLAWTGF